MKRVISLVEGPTRAENAFWPAPAAPGEFLAGCLGRAGMSFERCDAEPAGEGAFVVGWELSPAMIRRLEAAGCQWLSFRSAPWEYGKWIVEARANVPLPGTQLPGLPRYELREGRKVQMLQNAALLLPDPPFLAGELRTLYSREEELLGLYSMYSMVVIHHSFVTDAAMSCGLFDLGVQVRFDPLEFLLGSSEVRALAGADALVEPLCRARGLAPVVWENAGPGALFPMRRLAAASFWRPLLEGGAA